MGERADDAAFTRAATAELAPATTRPMNAFKAELARRTLVRALRTLATTGGGTA